MYQFTDGQIGDIVWHARNTQGKLYGEFISTTGARFTVRDTEVRAIDPGARQVRASTPAATVRAQRGNVALILCAILFALALFVAFEKNARNNAMHAAFSSAHAQALKGATRE